MPYMNLTTNEYPRFAGDVALAPNAQWVFVEDTPTPQLGERQLLTEGAPEQDAQGVWRQTWVVSTLTPAEWEQRRLDLLKGRLAAVGLSVEDLKLLLAEGN